MPLSPADYLDRMTRSTRGRSPTRHQVVINPADWEMLRGGGTEDRPLRAPEGMTEERLGRKLADESAGLLQGFEAFLDDRIPRGYVSWRLAKP